MTTGGGDVLRPGSTGGCDEAAFGLSPDAEVGPGSLRSGGESGTARDADEASDEDVDAESCCLDGPWVASGFSATAYLNVGIDLIVASFMSNNDIPHGTLMVLANDGRLVHIKGYTNCTAYDVLVGNDYSKRVGLSDADDPFCADIHTKFRIGSVSKVLAAVTVLKMIDDGKINDGGRLPANPRTRVARGLECVAGRYAAGLSSSGISGLYDVTLLQFLTHSSGLCDGHNNSRSLSGVGCSTVCTIGALDDPTVATALAQELPVTLTQKVQWLDQHALDAAPGDCYSYSNSGFMVLGDVINGASRGGFEGYFLRKIAGPLGLTDTEIADADIEDVKDDEAPAYDSTADGADYPYYSVMSSTYDGTYPGSREERLKAYGKDNLREGAAAGGWLSSAADMAKFAKDLLVDPASAVISSAARTSILTPRFYVFKETTSNWSYAWTMGLAFYVGVTSSGDFTPTGVVDKIGNVTGGQAKLHRMGSESGELASGCCYFWAFNRDVSTGSTLVDPLERLLANATFTDWAFDARTDFMGSL